VVYEDEEENDAGYESYYSEHSSDDEGDEEGYTEKQEMGAMSAREEDAAVEAARSTSSWMKGPRRR
jgi:hypothetical protein